MDKRTFLAIILSLMVLMIYNIITPRPTPRVTQPVAPSISQSIDGKVDIIALEDSKGDLARSETASPSKQKLPDLELVSNSLLLRISPLDAGLQKIELKNPQYSPPIINFMSLENFKNGNFTVIRKEDRALLFRMDKDDYTVDILYELTDNSFTLNKSVAIRNKTKMSKVINLDLVIMHINTSSLDNDRGQMAEHSLLEYSISTNSGTFRKNNAYKFNQKEEFVKEGSVNWVGFRNRYFCTLIKPEFEVKSYGVRRIDDHNLELFAKAQLNINANDTIELRNLVYNGPQDLNVLAKLGHNFENIVSFKMGGFSDIMALGQTDIIGKAILSVLNFIHKIVHNWGVSIILLAIFIYGITYPLTAKSMSSMKQMQLLQPKIAKIKEQHKGNSEKLNKEMMELYKSHNVNPVSGCLPLFFQMPIFIVLYQVLSRTYNFKGAEFLWIKDLTLPDRLLILPFSLPLVGNEFNILPIIVMISMYVQQRATAKQTVITDPDQLMQQKMMTLLMPVIIGAVFYKAASGLPLYYSTYYILSTLTQLRLSKATQKLHGK